jgi:glycosyltransferase involved in cell wall biosynthesis
MRIVLDLQACQTESRFRGMGRYSMSLAKAIAKNANNNHEIWLFLNGLFPDTIPYIRQSFDGLIPKERIFVFSAHGPVAEVDPQNEWRARASELIREYALSQLKPDIVHINSLFEGYGDDAVTSIGKLDSKIPTAVTLYDLIPYVDPEACLPNAQMKKWYYRKIQSLKNANLFLAISEYSKKEAIDNLGIAQENILNISAAINENFKQVKYSEEQKNSIFSRYNIKKPFVMYSPGGFEERKNIKRLIEAYSLLSTDIKKEHQLVITGKIHEETKYNLQAYAKKFNISNNELIFTGYLEDDDLVAMYNFCKLFVCPSLHEGFGLPPLEAMACGAPAIGSNCTSIPEVIGRQDALFVPFRAKSISDKISKALTNDSFLNSLREHALKQAKKFSWDESAKRALGAFETLYQKNISIKTQQAEHGDREYKRLLSSIAEIDAKPSLIKDDLLNLAENISQNMIIDNTKQLLVDISELVQRDAKTGIQRVVKNILRCLIKNQPQGYQLRPVYFDGKHYRYADRFRIESLQESLVNLNDENLHDEVAEFSRGDVFLCIDLTAAFLPIEEDFLIKINNLGVGIYFIVYDILPILHPEWWPIPTGTVIENWLRIVVKISTGIICISKSTEKDVKRWVSKNYPGRSEPLKISHFYLGADIEKDIVSRTEESIIVPINNSPEKEEDSGVIFKLKSNSSFLMVGTIEPRKGHMQTLAAFEKLWSEGLDINLAIVGKQGWMVEKLMDILRNHPQMNNRLFWLEGISDEYLLEVYSASTCLIAASEGEGFGLPLIEAAMHKLPIIARDIPVFREVAGDYAFYFNSNKPKDLAKAIKNWLNLYKEGKHPKSDDMPRLTWEQSTEQLMDIIFNDKWYYKF